MENMEMFDVIDSEGNVIGVAPRSSCHGNPSLRHRTVHVVVQSETGLILLQKRSLDKDVQPGKWDTAVGGHLTHGETFEAAARREMAEEIGLLWDGPLEKLFEMSISNDFESELSMVFRVQSAGPFRRQETEVDDLRFWSVAELKAVMGKGVLTPYLEHELELLFAHDAQTASQQ